MAFATAADVQTRLGRDLSDSEEASADAVCVSVTELIIEIAGKAEADLDAEYFKALCVEKAVGVITRPDGAVASKSVGSFSVTYARESDGALVFLSEREEQTIRRIANGKVSGSSYPRAMPHEFVTEAEGG